MSIFGKFLKRNPAKPADFAVSAPSQKPLRFWWEEYEAQHGIKRVKPFGFDLEVFRRQIGSPNARITHFEPVINPSDPLAEPHFLAFVSRTQDKYFFQTFSSGSYFVSNPMEEQALVDLTAKKYLIPFSQDRLYPIKSRLHDPFCPVDTVEIHSWENGSIMGKPLLDVVLHPFCVPVRKSSSRNF